MAVHDYVIANGTGSAVRSDLNNALAAIVSNNSSSSEPGTTYAYQWWADTNANVLKIRNSSNDGWITLRELDGTMLIEDGSASTPGLAFADDVNTGIFSPAADQIGFATGGAERLEIGSSEVVFNDPSNDVDFRVESNGNASMLFVDGGNDRVGIGTSSPRRQFHIHESASATVGLMLTNADTEAANDSQGFQLKVGSDSHAEISQMENSHIGIFTNASERARIDSSGRFLYGTTDAANLNNAGGASARQAKAYVFNAPGTTTERYNLGLIGGASSATGPSFVLNKTRATSNSHTVVQSGDELGQIRFQGSDGTNYVQAARIDGVVDGTPGSNDMPGRLVFSTTADGASSPTERLRIDSSGIIFLGNSSSTENTIANTNQAAKAVISGGGAGCGIIEVHGASHSSDAKAITMDTDGSERFKIQSNGRINMPAVYNTAVSGSVRDLYIQDTGQLGYDSSTRATKGNINLLSNVDWLYQLQPSSFNFKVRDADGELTENLGTELQYGLIAEDVEPVAPELCFYDEVDGEQELRGVHYKKLIVPMLKALQEANAKITTLEAKVAALEAG